MTDSTRPTATEGTEAGVDLSVSQLRQLIDAVPHVLWMATAEGDCDFLSEQWAEYTGVPVKQHLGSAWVVQLHPDDRERAFQTWRQSVDTGCAMQVYCRVQRHDGVYRWFNVRGLPLRNADGRIVRWFGTNTDVHETFEARRALAEKEERLRYVLLATSECVYDWNIRARVTHRNEAFHSIFGAPAVVRSSERWWEKRIHSDDRQRVLDSAADAFNTRSATWKDEYRLMRPDGSYADVADHAYLLYDEDNKPLRMIGAIADITERKQIEESLRDTQGRLESAMAAGELATWIWDLVKDELYWDEAAYRMWGVTFDGAPMSSSRVIELMHPEDQSRVLAARAAFIGKPEDTDVEFRIVLPDGGTRWLLAKGRFTLDEHGRPIRMVGVYQNITERKRGEEARLASQKMEALGTLAGGIAHDFNNILLAIGGNAKLALDDIAAGDVDARSIKRSFEEVSKASGRAADLVKRILTFSRHDDPRREAVLLRPLVEEALRLLRPTLSTQIDIRTRYDDGALMAEIDAIQVHQVIMNLVTNSAHAIGNRSGVIEIALGTRRIDAEAARALQDVAPGDYAVLSVRDTGDGIDPAILGRIFDPFFTTKKPGEGTGLGLAVVHGIVRGQGGAVSVANIKDGGTEFRVYLPLADVDIAASGKHPALPMHGAGEHVLYVDDEEALVFLITRVLERMGYRVTGCIDPEKALTELNADAGSFDVLVTDLAMRGMNGFELTREAHKIRPDLPVVMTSGFLRTEDRDTAASCDIRELILKPNTVDELGLALDRVLRDIRAKSGATRVVR